MSTIGNLTTSEQLLIWGQGAVNEDHDKSGILLSVSEALKSSGFDFATILTIMKVIQEQGELPDSFSIVNNEYLVFSYGYSEEESETVYNLAKGEYFEEHPACDGIRKLMALTFWLDVGS